MGANGYFPGYYPPKNLDANGGGNVWPAQNGGDGISESGNFSDAFFVSPEYLVAYNRELLKQTMLKHEIVFKDQIQELHRLYRRQTELMGETRTNQMYHQRSNLSHSNAVFVPPKSYQIAGFPYINLPRSQTPGIIQSPLTFVQGMKGQKCPPYYPVKSEACSENVEFRDSKFRKVGKKVLDLQLPADEYIDCDEVDKNFSARPEISSYLMNRSPQVELNSVLRVSATKPALESENQKHFGDLSFHEFSGNMSSMFHSPLEHSLQNTRVTGNLSHGINAGKMYGAFHQCGFDNYVPRIEKKSESDVALRELCESRRAPIAVQALPCFNVPEVTLGKRNKLSVQKPGFSAEEHVDPMIIPFLSDVNTNLKTSRNSSVIRLSGDTEQFSSTPMESSSLMKMAKPKFFETCRSNRDAKSMGKCPALDLNMACESLLESDSELAVDKLPGESKGDRCVIDLNSSTNEVETDFTAPLSPENKECSPPRGEKSDLNQTETPILSPERDETARIAAEAIVALSSYCRDPLNASPDSLRWFAGIVSSMAATEHLPVGVDHFEAMTLSLAEAKAEELGAPREESTQEPLSLGRRKKGQARRRRKDFQQEILPGLAALSRFEVTEDLRTLEAAGNRCPRARKRAAVFSTDEVVSGVGEAVSLVEQIGGCWGTVTRRRRGRRFPVRVRNQKFIILS